MTTQLSESQSISADFPFESKYLEVKGSKIHYIEEGKGDPIVFLHGNPTSSYLWRNIIPYLSKQGRCIAPDLIGMGKSDKPDLDYGFFDTFEYLEAFIEGLELTNITLVLHDWGSGLGFHYANTHRENIKAIAFMEAMYRIVEWKDLPFSIRMPIKMMRTSFFGWMMGVAMNIFIKKMLPDMIIRDLTEEEKEFYAEPYPNRKSRKPLAVWPKHVPFGGKPKDIASKVEAYHEWLKTTDLPKLFLYATPGLANNEEDGDWIKENFPNTEVVNVGEGLHFIQEDRPHEIGAALMKWYASFS